MNLFRKEQPQPQAPAPTRVYDRPWRIEGDRLLDDAGHVLAAGSRLDRLLKAAWSPDTEKVLDFGPFGHDAAADALRLKRADWGVVKGLRRRGIGRPLDIPPLATAPVQWEPEVEVPEPAPAPSTGEIDRALARAFRLVADILDPQS